VTQKCLIRKIESFRLDVCRVSSADGAIDDLEANRMRMQRCPNLVARKDLDGFGGEGSSGVAHSCHSIGSNAMRHADHHLNDRASR
jgi:hypothetical protein